MATFEKPTKSQDLPPLFYKEPVILRFEEHQRKALRPAISYEFTRLAVAVPLLIGEFAAAVRHYPIVFSELGAPLAILGLREGQNLFVGRDGSWRKGTYVPAYLRRYPFIVTEVIESGQQFLAIDAASDRFADLDASADGEPLFDETGGSTPLAAQAIAFCQAYQADSQRSESFGLALVERDLLVPRQADTQFPDSSRFILDGFYVVDSKKFHALSDPGLLADWHAKGWLAAVAMHLASMQNWETLLNINAEDHSSQIAA